MGRIRRHGRRRLPKRAPAVLKPFYSGFSAGCARGVKRFVSCLCLFAHARLVAWYLDFSFEEKALRLHTDDGVQA